MSTLKDRLVFITGASSGIGEACARAFAREGARLLLCARRLERLEALADELKKEHGTRSRSFRLDVTKQPDVEKAFTALPREWSEIDVLVNNAGGAHGLDKFQEGRSEDWDAMLDTNVKGLLYVTRMVLPGMITRGRGHVINIGSIAGRKAYPGGAVYCGAKAAARAISEGLKMDLTGTPVRVSSVDPGLVETEFSLVRFKGDRERAKKVYENITPLSGDDVAEVVVWCASRPPHVNVSEVLILPTAQSSPTLVHRGPLEFK
jgi:NADP-dependent 3-hydroxy acid dehydrogenase YdfG